MWKKLFLSESIMLPLQEVRKNVAIFSCLKKKKIYFNVEKYINQFSKDQISLEQIIPEEYQN